MSLKRKKDAILPSPDAPTEETVKHVQPGQEPKPKDDPLKACIVDLLNPHHSGDVSDISSFFSFLP